ncbi:MAG: hypothetical protein WKG00_37600 [Polyangiaceae bacterium]
MLLAHPGSAVAQEGSPRAVATAGDTVRDSYAADAQGRRLRVRFDPGRRLHLGIAHAPVIEGDDLDAQRWQIDGGLSWRHVVDFEDEGIRWKLEHQVLDSAVAFAGDDTAVDGELYALRFLRWSDDGSITLPSTPPRRIGFPFGIGFEAGAGRVDLHQSDGWRGEIGVARAALLLDLLPRREQGSFLTIGVGPRYDLRLAAEDAATGTQRVEHLVAPFSQPELTWRQESGDGHHAFEASARGGYVWTSSAGAGAQAAAHARYEVLALAVNDMAVTLGAELRWRWDRPARPGEAEHEVLGCWGLRLGAPLD